MYTVCSLTFEDYLQKVIEFHGHAAPGMLIGGCMIDMAYRHLPEGPLFDVIVETPKCLPDAVQLLTPCTVGNGWLRIIDLGRYALSMYDKADGTGVRVYVDSDRIAGWPTLQDWFFKRIPKKDQDREAIFSEIRRAGSRICAIRRIRVAPDFLVRRRRGRFAACPQCGEGYPLADGALCLGCQGLAPYIP